MGDTIVNGEPKTPAEALRKRAHAASVAVTLEGLMPALQVAAKAHGYALAAHGSMARDVDLIAAPWTDEASTAPELIAALVAACQATLDCGYLEIGRKPTRKPHGRLAHVIHIGPKCYLDVSVMPRRRRRKPKDPS